MAALKTSSLLPTWSVNQHGSSYQHEASFTSFAFYACTQAIDTRSTSTSTYFTRRRLSIRQNCILTRYITRSGSIRFESSSYAPKQALRFFLDDQWWRCKDIDWFRLCITSSSSNALLSCCLRAQLKRFRTRYTTFPRVTWLSQAWGSKKILHIGA